MSFNNSDKEFYFSLYLKFNKTIIGDILKINLGEIELDKNFYGRKIDLYSVLSDGRQLFMELQLGLSDNIHLQQLIKVIEQQELNNFVLIWVAIDFRLEMLNEIEEKINSSNKNIYFIALRLNGGVLDRLEILNNVYINKVMDNLKILDEVKNHFEIKEIYYRVNDNSSIGGINKNKRDEIYDLTRKYDVMRCLLMELRKQISYFPTVHRDKKLDNNVIVLGAGKADINFYIGLNRGNYLFTEIRFGERQKDIFESLVGKKDEIYDSLDYAAEFDIKRRKIGTYLYFSHNKRGNRIKQIARITHKYIQVFSEYTFPNWNVEIERG